MRRKSHLSRPIKRRRHKNGSDLHSIPEKSCDSLSRNSSLDRDNYYTGSVYSRRVRALSPNDHVSSASSFDSCSHESVKDYPSRKRPSLDSFPYNLDDSLPLTDQLKRAIYPSSFDSLESMQWEPTAEYNYIGINPECCVEEEDFTLIKKELDMDHIGRSSTWNEDKLCSWYPLPTMKQGTQSPNHTNDSDESCLQNETFPSGDTNDSVQVLPPAEEVTSVMSSNGLKTDCSLYLNDHGYGKPSKSLKAQHSQSFKVSLSQKSQKVEPMKEAVQNKTNCPNKQSVGGHECDRCGTILKTADKIKDHLERHKQLESLRRHTGQLPSKELLGNEVPVLVNRALKGVIDDPTVSFVEKRVLLYARRLYFNSFPLWKEISRELVHEVWQHITPIELAILPTLDLDFFVWSRNMWLTTGGRREAFVLNLIFLYPDDSEVVEAFFFKFFVKLNDAVYKFAMRCLGSPDVVKESLPSEVDIRRDTGMEELHTLCSLVLRTYLKRASQNKTVKGWNAIYKCMKRNFVENAHSGKPPKSTDMQQWALGHSNDLVTTKQAFRFFFLVYTVIENINRANPKCDGPVALYKMVLRAVYLRQDIIRAWDKLVAMSHFEEMDSLYVLEMLVKSFAFFSSCATARKQKKSLE